MTGQMRVEPVKFDHYGRVVAQIYAGGINLACAQLARGRAVYVGRWDDGGRLARECR
jgi:endonuclease YncB( thermonuclease family)